ncbi:MAG: Omp28-related outer membrane protein [Flavobacteriaceae bacterium]
MIKKLLSSIACLFFVFTAFAQTIVSTNPENKKVILEEFTGINCVFCPDGHIIARNIQNANPGNVFLINIHAGGFATPTAGQPDFRTPEGNGIRSFFGANFFPSGMINRHSFGGSTVLSRTSWASSSNQILAESSYLNMAVEAEVDVQTREITILVEAYYTGNSPVSTNKLNIALLQNNTLGWQTGGNMGNSYNHMHRLIDMPTGQWGEDITSTTTGSFIDRTYTFTIPADNNGIPIVLEDLELVVFMAEGNAEIISGNGAYPSFINLPLNNDAKIEATNEIEAQCGTDYAPKVTIQNRGNNPLTSLDIQYSINGGATNTYSWTGNLNGYESEEVTLDPIPYTIQSTNTISFSIPNDEDNSNNTTTNTFSELTTENINSLRLRITTDDNGDEITWNIKNLNGDIVQSGGPYDNNTNVELYFDLVDVGCHEFTLVDTGGDGKYTVRLSDLNNDVILFNSPSVSFGEYLHAPFITNGILSNGNTLNQKSIAIFPNPAQSKVTITNAENATVLIYDITGKKVLSQNNISLNQEIGISNLQIGTYFVKVEKDGYTSVLKLLVTK